MSAVIPAAKPKVTVEPDQHEPEQTIAICQVWTCGWAYANVVKSDVVQHAKWHRDHHKAAAAEVQA